LARWTGYRRRLGADQRHIWADGDFAKIGAAQVIVGERLARAVDIHTGHRVLDVASGSGNAALAAAAAAPTSSRPTSSVGSST
jgi:cyclopropane fatty-acyl-phospholipid synthase-like methyltransferase